MHNSNGNTELRSDKIELIRISTETHKSKAQASFDAARLKDSLSGIAQGFNNMRKSFGAGSRTSSPMKSMKTADPFNSPLKF